MKRKTCYFLLLALVLTLLSLAGCGGDKENSVQPGEGQSVDKSTVQDTADDSVVNLFAKSKQIEGMSYDYVITSKDIAINSKVWVAGNKIKTDSVLEGKNIISIFDGNTFYTYFPEEGRAMKLTSDQLGESKTETPLDFTNDDEIIPDNYKVVETVVYDGVQCKLVIVNSADGNEQSKMWVRQDYGIPIRIESTDPGGEKTVMEFKNLKIGKQPADTFKLPTGVEVIDASELFNNQLQKP